MKKDKRFLDSLEKELSSLDEKDRVFILDKYRKIIDEELANKKKIGNIIKGFGPVKKVAETEIELLKNKKVSIFDKIKDFIKKDLAKIDDKKNDIDLSRFKENIKFKYQEIVDKFNIKKEENSVKRKNKKVENEKKKILKDKIKKAKEYQREELRLAKEEEKKLKKEEESSSIISEVIEEEKNSLIETVEVVRERHLFESKKDRKKRIIISCLGVLATIILLFIWLWISVLFIAICFAFLDGVRIIGAVIAAFGIDILWLWITIMINRLIFKKKNPLMLNLIVVSICIVLIAFGTVLTVRKIYNIDHVEDVSEKYTYTTKVEKFALPSDETKKMNIIFNSNYDTQYVINYDSKLSGIVKIEAKYYENYYDYFAKKTSNDLYISLKVEDRDRISSYISDFKDGKIYDSDELARYLIKINIAPEDLNRIEVID